MAHKSPAAAASVTVTLRELITAAEVLGRLGQPVTTIVDGKAIAVPQRIPIKTSYHVARLLSAVMLHVTPFHDQRNALLRELGEERDPTEAEKQRGVVQPVFELGEHAEDFTKQINELSKTEVTLSEWLLTCDLLDPYQIDTPDLAALLPLIEPPSK